MSLFDQEASTVIENSPQSTNMFSRGQGQECDLNWTFTSGFNHLGHAQNDSKKYVEINDVGPKIDKEIARDHQHSAQAGNDWSGSLTQIKYNEAQFRSGGGARGQTLFVNEW